LPYCFSSGFSQESLKLPGKKISNLGKTQPKESLQMVLHYGAESGILIPSTTERCYQMLCNICANPITKDENAVWLLPMGAICEECAEECADQIKEAN
jgi:hypothetical protein